MYKYNCPTKRGYERIKLSESERKEIFNERKNHFRKGEYYKKINSNNETTTYYAEYFTNNLGKILTIIWYIPALFIEGLGNFKEVTKDFLDTFREKERGKFYTDIRDVIN